MKEEFECVECGEVLTANDTRDENGELCNYCCNEYDQENGEFLEPKFANPGGHSALRLITNDNPRNLPCPTCDEPNKLTPADKAQGYCCDQCADLVEGNIPSC